jgi:hypothetical protein
MKTLLLKITILSFCLVGFISLNVTAITVTANGNYYIYDPYNLGATYNVYAYIEVNGNPYPCNTNPFATGVVNGQIIQSPNPLYFYNVYAPTPPNTMPYRVVLRVVRIFDGAVMYGYSDWSDPTGFSPWSPDPIRINY